MALDQPSGRSAPGALPGLVAICIGAGLVAGLAVGAVGLWFKVLGLFPAAIGLLVGAAAGAQVGIGRIRVPLAAGLIALAGGALGQIVTHGVDYASFRSSVPDGIGFVEFMRISAQEGVTITRFARSSGPSFTGMGAWGFWAIEALIAGGLAAWMAVGEAKAPFCDVCDAWYTKDDTIALGAPENTAWQPLIAAAGSGDWRSALQAFGPPSAKSASVVRLLRCATCREHRPVLVLQVVSGLGGGKGEQKEVARLSIAPERAEALTMALAERVAQKASTGA